MFTLLRRILAMDSYSRRLRKLRGDHNPPPPFHHLIQIVNFGKFASNPSKIQREKMWYHRWARTSNRLRVRPKIWVQISRLAFKNGLSSILTTDLGSTILKISQTRCLEQIGNFWKFAKNHKFGLVWLFVCLYACLRCV